MKKILPGITLVLMACLVTAYIYRAPIKQAAYDLLTRDMFVATDSDDFDPGPAIGSHFPGVTASWRGGDVRLLNRFAGPRGTAFVAIRSVSWCPYCMRQVIELQAHKADWDAAGIGLVAMSYDAPEAQQAFIQARGIDFPILHDVDTLSFRTLGILNPDYQLGDTAYGIPYPGMIVIDPQGVVVGKIFLEAYSSRVDALSALAYAQQALTGAIEPPPVRR